MASIELRPHLEKLKAAISNPKCSDTDVRLLKEALELYKEWDNKLTSLTSKGKERVKQMVDLLNWYKNKLEVEMIVGRKAEFLRRQRGQLKLESSVLEEFLIRIIHPDIIRGLGDVTQVIIGPAKTYMSMSFFPSGSGELSTKRIQPVLKEKDMDFLVGRRVFYKFAEEPTFFGQEVSVGGSFAVSLVAAECKTNLDKTMFQEAAGTATRLKQGTPMAKYFLLVEYLDMTPEDPRSTDIDNVFLLRHARRLSVEKRDVLEEVKRQREEFPIDYQVIWKFIEEIQAAVYATWLDEKEVLQRGSFI